MYAMSQHVYCTTYLYFGKNYIILWAWDYQRGLSSYLLHKLMLYPNLMHMGHTIHTLTTWSSWTTRTELYNAKCTLQPNIIYIYIRTHTEKNVWFTLKRFLFNMAIYSKIYFTNKGPASNWMTLNEIMCDI